VVNYSEEGNRVVVIAPVLTGKITKESPFVCPLEENCVEKTLIDRPVSVRNFDCGLRPPCFGR
jgi:hypothetical protein